jgi:DNA-binding CsgD family transcriptional regulator
VADDPMREERWRLLVLALYRAHRQADALAALRRARTTLSEELGVDPGPALRALEAEVLAQSPSLDAPARPTAVATAGVPVPRAGRPGPREPAPTPPGEEIVDRDRELLALRTALTEAMAGQGRLALIEGPAGIGKTRLLQEVRRLAAAEGARVLTARGSQLERAFGFGAVRQLFETTLADPGDRADLLRGSAAAATWVFGDIGSAEPVDRADGSFAILHGLYWLTVNLTETQPVVLAVDDLQWCDPGSLRALGFLLRRLEGLPVLIAATLRTGEQHPGRGAHRRAGRGPGHRGGSPRTAGRGRDARTGAGPARRRGPAGVRRRLPPHDGRQPAAASAAAACPPGRGRPAGRLARRHGHRDRLAGVSSMVLMRLGRLPDDCTAVARAVAVLGDGCELATSRPRRAGRDATAAGAIATLAGPRCCGRTARWASCTRWSATRCTRPCPAVERELSHERAAAELHGSRGDAEQVAAHLMLAPRRGDQQAVRLLREAASTAADRGAADAARTYLERALAEPPTSDVRPELLLELGRLGTLTDGPAAIVYLRDAYETTMDPARRAEVATMLARTLVFAGGPGEATRFARSAAAALPADQDDARQGLLALERIGGYMHGLPEQEWLVGRPELHGEGPGARMLAATLAWEELIVNGDREQCLELARFALADGELQRVDTGLLWVVASFTLEMGEVEMGGFWDRTLADAFARGSLFSALAVHLWRGYMLWHHGRLREALNSVQTSNEQTELWGAPAVGIPYGQAFIIGILLEMGDVPAARAYVDSVQDQQRIGDGARLFEENHARLLAAEGHLEEGLARLEAAAELQTIVVNPVWRPWRTYRAPVLAALGRADEARALMAEEVALARTWGAPSILGRTMRVAGELGGEGSVEMLREAYLLLGPTVARYELACAELALARVTSDAQERESLLRAALDLAATCGSPGLYKEAADELVAAGAGAPPPFEDVLTLTATERQVAELAAAGSTVSVIAQSLFVTPATVEGILADVRTRLGVRSDAELGIALATV